MWKRSLLPSWKAMQPKPPNKLIQHDFAGAKLSLLGGQIQTVFANIVADF